MRNLSKGCMLFLLIAVVSCSQQEDVLLSDNQSDGELVITKENQDVVEKLISMGYDISVIQELDDYFLVGGDILFSKKIEDYANIQEDPRTRHASTNNLVNLTKLNITVRVDNTIPTSGTDNWRTAVQSAINDWNGINNCGVFFVYTTSNYADITVKSDNNSLPDGTIASAGFPTNGNPFNTVLINLNFNSNSSITEASKRYNMVHELGHAIGFRHTNWDTRGEGAGSVGANLIPGTPNQDPNSVMNGGTALFSWSGFSTFDLTASRYLYPFAVKMEYVTVYESDSWDDVYVEDDIYLNTYTNGSFTTRLNLPANRTASYQEVETITNVWPSGVRRRNFTKTLTSGNNRFFLNDLVTEECSYDYGNPVGNCYDRYISFTSVNLF